jgi:trehalose 6-phosphate phosphatase
LSLLGTNSAIARLELSDPRVCWENEDGRTSRHIITTLSPKNLLRWGEGALRSFRLNVTNAPSIEGATAGAVAALSNAPLALFLDVDGTLLDLAERPENVVTPSGLIATLAGAERKLAGALALISGRSIDNIDRLFTPLRLRVSGVHGAEIRFDPDGSAARSVAGDLPQSLLTALRRAVEPFPGVFVEDKRFSFTVHYRLAPAAEQSVRRIVKQVVESLPIAVDVMDAHCAIEVKGPCFNKGGAIAAFLSTSTFDGRKPIFVGDDTTDESGFALVSARGGLAYSVGSPRPGAVNAFSGPRAVRAWLAAFADRGGDA